jgi:hypothetical protein
MPLTDDIDWSDPIAANRLLRMKLAELEATQGNGAGNNRQHFYNDRDEYGDDDEYYEEQRYAPPPQPQQKSSRPHEKKKKNVQRRDKPGTSFRVNRTFDNNRCKEIDRGNLHLVKRLASVQQRHSNGQAVYGQAPRRKRIGNAGINRRKKQSQIDIENQRIARRLGTMKATKGIKRTTKKKGKKKAQYGPIPITVRRDGGRTRGISQPEWQS